MAATTTTSKECEQQSSSPRVHFKVGSRKSKLAMVQTEYIISRLSSVYPEYTFEIVNFDTKGDQILNVALPKIGDKGLFTKELEDALEQGSIDFVVHSLKDMSCQTLPDNLIISGVPEREDPHDALVMAERWRATKSTLDDLSEGSVIGTSSLRRISQLKQKYPKFKFETIRGNLQTRFAKLDSSEHKFDAIILAAAGLKRMGEWYEKRISQILKPEICMHAVSQGALGIESRRDDLVVMKMINSLNHEETLLRCIAERTLLTKLEGGCSAPIGVVSQVTDQGIWLEGAVFDLDGTRCIKDKFEIGFNAKNVDCPVLSINARRSSIQETSNETTTAVNSNKRSAQEAEIESEEKSTKDDDESTSKKKLKKPEETTNNVPVVEVELKEKRHYSFIVDLNIDENKMIKAELCGLHLAELLKEQGADLLIEEVKAIVHKKD